MPSIKDFNRKIKSLKNTQKITRTMKMVSASKLRKAQQAQVKAKEYAVSLTSMISRIAGSLPDAQTFPLLASHKEHKNVLILIYTSDKGLCGAFNNNCYKQVLLWMAANRSKYQKIQLSCCGRRGYNFFRKKETVKKYYENITAKPTFMEAEKVGKDLIQSYLQGEFDEIYLVYNQFFSPIKQQTVFVQLFPIDPKALIKGDEKMGREHIFEPSAAELVESLIPHYVYFKIFFALLENAAGEYGARMSAMDSATKNASELMNRYTLLRNRARQSQITTELTEIVAGAEALK